MKKGTDMQASSNFQSSIVGITTLEKIIEKILKTAIYDEKDIEKREKRESGSLMVPLYNDTNQYSMTIMNEESQANLNEMTELLNETAH
jgi:CBS domain containing-hemolysin-like protein